MEPSKMNDASPSQGPSKGPEGSGQVVVASAGTSSANIQKLNGSNFLPWKRQVTIVLKLRGLFDAITQDFVDEVKDMQATLVLLETMDEAHKIQVQAEASAKEIMSSLERQYASASENNLHRLLTTYFNFKKEPNDTIFQHIGKLKELRARLASLGETQSENMFQVTLIQSLTGEFGDISSIWNATPPAMKSTEFLMNIIQEKEERLKGNRREESSFLMRSRPRRMSMREIEERKKNTNCGKCGQKGHWWRECNNQPKEDRTRNNARQENPNFVANVGDLGPELKKKWLADTGATSHMCNERDWFEELNLLDSDEMVTVGDGSVVKVIGKGTVRIKTVLERENGEGTLRNVLYVPDLTTNLISIGACAEKGIETSFGKTKCILSRNGVVLMLGHKIGGRLYELKIVAIEPKMESALLLRGSRSKAEWHRVLGHPCDDRLFKLLNDKELGVDIGREREQELCGDCLMGSGKRASHPSMGGAEDNPGKVHIDLSGKINKRSLDGYYYYMMCKDEATEYCHIYFLRDKSESTKAIADMISRYEVEGGHQVRKICSDNGSEFSNERNRLLFLKEHIVHETCAPRTPEQNGRIEREIGSMSAMARTLLATSNLPTELWAHAMETACYLKNRLPTKRSIITPYERFMQRKPFIKHLAEFGSQVHVINNWSYLHKFDPKTEPGFLVGYTQRCNTYKIYIPRLERVVETSDVYFRPHSQPKLSKDTVAGGGSSTEQTIEQILPLVHELETWEGPSFSASLTDTEPGKEIGGGFDNQERDEIERERRSRVLTEYFDNFRMESLPEEERGSRESEEMISSPGPSVIGVQSPTKSPEKQHCEKCAKSPRSVASRQLFDDVPQGQPASRANSITLQQNLRASPNSLCDPFQGHTIQRSPDESNQASRVLLRAKELIRRPGRFAGLTLDSVRQMSDSPDSYEEATTGPNKQAWCEAIKEELGAHESNKTWDIVKRPESGCTLTAKWVFTVKRDLEGNIDRFKARLVARGYKQREGIDFSETFAPVAKAESIRVLLAICAKERLSMRQFDVSSAFLYGEIEEDIYLDAPEGVVTKPNHCLKLRKSLYGLRQAPRCWHSKFDTVMKTMHFKQTISDPCIYVTNDKQTYVSIYVDDGLIISHEDKTCENVMETLNNSFKTKLVSAGNFLGMHVIRTANGIKLNQRRYIKDMVQKYELTDSNDQTSPLADTKQLFTGDSPRVVGNYREMIGSLLYCATSTRPDILFPTTLLARFCEEPRQLHMAAIRRVIKYLNTTKDVGLIFDEEVGTKVQIDGYSDADWAGNPEDSKSTSGVLILLSGAPVIFSSKKQTITALSSAEAEYIAAGEAAKAIEWLVGLLEELGISMNQSRLYIDNRSTIKQIQNNNISTKSKHVRLKFHFVRQLYNDKLFLLSAVSSDEQKADFLTKNLPGPKLKSITESSNIKTSFSKEEMTNKISGKGARWHMSHLSLAFMTLLALGMYTESVKLVRAPNTVWLPTEIQVDEGAIEGIVDFTYLSICRSIAGLEEANEKNDLARRSYAKIKEECMKFHLAEIEPLIRALQKCKPEGTRKKRIVWFVPILVILAISSFAGGITYSTVRVVQAHNRIDSLEDRVPELEDEVKLIRDLNHSMHNTSSEALKSISEKSERTRQTVEEVVNFNPSLAWNTAKIYFKQQEDVKNLKEVVRSCKANKVAMANLGELIDFVEFKEYKEQDTLLTGISSRNISNETVITIEFLATKKSPDTKVYKIKGFNHYSNLMKDPHIFTYAGPSYAVYNSTSNCTRGIDENELDNNRVYKSCFAPDYRDPKLDTWVRSEDSGISAQLGSPQILTTGGHKLIYCTFFNISINDESVPCPIYPISLPRNLNFTVGNYTHIAEKIHIKGFTGFEKIQFPNYKSVEVDQDYIDQLALINELKAKNDLLKRVGVNMTGSGSPALETITNLPWTYFFPMVSVILTFTSIIALCGNRGNNEKITVVQNAPRSSEVYPDLDEVQSGCHHSHHGCHGHHNHHNYCDCHGNHGHHDQHHQQVPKVRIEGGVLDCYNPNTCKCREN